jgi:hypothetical protein
MQLNRAVVSVASIFLGLSAASAQQSATTTNASPPLFQGIMVDAKGKTVGRLLLRYQQYVVRQISGIWMALPVADLTTGFQIWAPNNILYYYQSDDCTGPAFLPVDQNSFSDVLALGIIATVPPATQPSIYFAGKPESLVVKSFRFLTAPCQGGFDFNAFVGIPQSVLVSSLGLTLPFSVK